MRVRAAIEGRLAEHMQAEIEGMEIAVTRSRDRVSRALRDRIRRPIVRGFGEKTAKSWTAKVYPAKGRSSGSAIYQYDASKGDHVIRRVVESGPIRSPDGFWQALPTDAALKVLPKTLHHSRGRGGHRNRSAVEFIEQRFGVLTYVYLKGPGRGKRAYLVAEARETSRRLKSGGVKRGYGKARRLKSGRYGKNVQSVVMFVLVPETKRPSLARIDLDRLADAAAADWARGIVADWPDILKPTRSVRR